MQGQVSRPPPSRVEQEWKSVLQRIAAGEHQALAELYDVTSAAVFGLALRIVKARDVAEDVVVEVYSQVWTQAAAYDSQRGPPIAWLLTITRSRAIDLLRARGRARTEEPLEFASGVPSETPGPEESHEALERRRLVRSALENLPPEQRQVIELAYFSGFSHSEIAVRLGQPLGTVKTRVRLGLMRLRELLAPLVTSVATPIKEQDL